MLWWTSFCQNKWPGRVGLFYNESITLQETEWQGLDITLIYNRVAAHNSYEV